MPDFYTGANVYNEFLELIKIEPKILLPNTEIYTIFGMFPGALWNGGAANISGTISSNLIKRYIDYYNQVQHIPLTFNFTNKLITKEQCYDNYCNIIAELGNNGMNTILCCEGELESYLRATYKNYKFSRSIVDSENVPYCFQSKFGEYEVSVLQRAKNNQWDYLNNIPQVYRPRIEFLCNDLCPDNCPYIYTHYNRLAQKQIDMSELDPPAIECKMSITRGPFSYKFRTTQKNYISREMIDRDYLPKGFCKFKCSGRFSLPTIILNLIYYLVAPEYRPDMLNILMQAVIK